MEDRKKENKEIKEKIRRNCYFLIENACSRVLDPFLSIRIWNDLDHRVPAPSPFL
jgi:hypothetical protein